MRKLSLHHFVSLGEKVETHLLTLNKIQPGS